MLKYDAPSWFYGEKRLDYRIREVNGCVITPPEGMVRRPFRYDDTSMYAAVSDLNYIAKNVVPGESQSFDGESLGFKISSLAIAQYVDDVSIIFLACIIHCNATINIRNGTLSKY